MPQPKFVDPIFAALDKLHQAWLAEHKAPLAGGWGDILDAGTGHTSLKWVSGLASQRWTAVTGEKSRAQALESMVRGSSRPQDRILVGNWMDPAFLEGETFDVVLADYLLGAVERFAPYFQYSLLKKLREITRSRFYLVGLEPYPEPLSPAEQVVNDIANFRDACHLHLGERYHREFPMDWVVARLQECGFIVRATDRFPILYGKSFVDAELGLAEKLLNQLPTGPLRKGMQGRLAEIHKSAAAALKKGGLPGGYDYLIAADPR